jgi:hypothetical protein
VTLVCKREEADWRKCVGQSADKKDRRIEQVKCGSIVTIKGMIVRARTLPPAPICKERRQRRDPPSPMSLVSVTISQNKKPGNPYERSPGLHRLRILPPWKDL